MSVQLSLFHKNSSQINNKGINFIGSGNGICSTFKDGLESAGNPDL